jgi:glycine dehydrogenase
MLAGDWDRGYSRMEAAYPIASLGQDRYWPPVRRIDGAYGDRRLVCACRPPEDFT